MNVNVMSNSCSVLCSLYTARMHCAPMHRLVSAMNPYDSTAVQCESKKIPPRGPDIFSFFSQTVENL